MSERWRFPSLARRTGAGLILLGLAAVPVAAQPAGENPCEVVAKPGETPSDLVLRVRGVEYECRKDAGYLFAVGQALNTLQLYDQAVNRLEGALMLEPDHWPARLEYAIALEGAGDRSSADALLAQLEAEPALPEALRGTIRERRQRWRLPAALSFVTRQSLALLGGHDNNLLGSTRTSQLDLTLPNGTLPVVLDPDARPRAGGFGRLDWRQDIRLIREDGSYWNLAVGANIRLAPGNSGTNFNLLGLTLERVSPNQQGPYLIGAVQNLNTETGDIYRLVGVGAGLDQGWANDTCRTRLGGELQYRQFPQVEPFNGLYGGLLAQFQCHISGWHARLRAGKDTAEYNKRPGGDQLRTALLVGKQTTIGTHRLNLEIDLEHQADENGFSPLLESNLRRKINKAAYRIEYTIAGKAVEPLLGVEWLRQRSNLALYDINTRIAYLGLRWTW